MLCKKMSYFFTRFHIFDIDWPILDENIIFSTFFKKGFRFFQSFYVK